MNEYRFRGLRKSNGVHFESTMQANSEEELKAILADQGIELEFAELPPFRSLHLRSLNRVAFASAWLIHPVLFIVSFFVGFIFGWRGVSFGGSAGSRQFLIGGGLNACAELLLLYLFTLGILPLAISLLSARVAYKLAARADEIQQVSRKLLFMWILLGAAAVWLAIYFLFSSLVRVVHGAGTGK